MNLEEVAALARRIAADVVEPNAAAVDRDGAWPEANLRALQKAGLGGLVVPKDHGGLGLGLEAVAAVGEILGESCASTGLCFGMHHVGTAVIASKATKDHVERYLRPIAAGQHLTTLSLSEPGTGAHFYIPETQLVPAKGGYEVFGSKCFTTNGAHADSYVVSARSEDDAIGVFSCFMMPNEGDGMAWGKAWDGLGMRGNSSRSVTLDGLQIPLADRLGDEGDQNWYVFQVVAPYFLVAMAGTYLGVAQRALREATEHLQNRVYAHTGRSLAQVDVLQHRLGKLWARVRAAKAYLMWAAREGDQGGPEALTALIASKAEIGTVAVETVNECMTLTGGRDYRDGKILERLLRDVRAVHVMSPTTDLLYTWAGRSLLGQPLLVD